MNDFKQEWLKTQLHWDDKETIQSRNFPKSVALNWRKMTGIMRSLCKEKRVLQGHKLFMVDVGCGAGTFYSGLEPAVETYVGIDPSDKMLLKASGDSGQFFIRGTGEHLPLQSGIADVVLLKSMLDQCYDPDRVISESYRVLKDDGWLLISLSNRDSYYAILRNSYSRLRRNRSRHFFHESHQFYFNMMDTLTMLKKERFEIIHQFPMGYFVFPRCMEWLMSDRVLLRCVDIMDRIGSVALPQKGGMFVLAGRRSMKL